MVQLMFTAYGATWRAEYGEINEMPLFRFGYKGDVGWEYTATVEWLDDLIVILEAVQPLAVGQLVKGPVFQARKRQNLHQDVVVEPRSDTSYPTQYFDLYSEELNDLILTLKDLAARIPNEKPEDWDASDQDPVILDLSKLESVVSQKADKTTTVNGHPLSEDVELSLSDMDFSPVHDAINTAFDKYETALPSEFKYRTASLSIRPDRNLTWYRNQLTRMSYSMDQITLCVYSEIQNATSNSFNARVSEELIRGVFDIAVNELGLEVSMFKPHIVTPDGGDGFYRAKLAPTDPPTFFQNWETELMWFMGIAYEYGVPILCISCEQSRQTTSASNSYWEPIVNNLRTAFPGIQLTAAMTTLEIGRLYNSLEKYGETTYTVASLMDHIGFNPWVQLFDRVYTPENPNITMHDLVPAWFKTANGDYPILKINALSVDLNKPYFITEIGCVPYNKSLDNLSGAYKPEHTPENYTHDTQALLYESAFLGLLNSNRCSGVAFWHSGGVFNYYDVIPAVQGGVDLNQPETSAEKILRMYMKEAPR